MSAIPMPAITACLIIMADDETLDSMGMESGYDLTELYRGAPMHPRNGNDPVREPILLEAIETGEDLYRLVRNAPVHEVTHYFAFNDAAIAELEASKTVARRATFA